MDALIGSMDSQVVLVVAAIVVSLLLLRLLFRILNAGLGLLLAIGAVVLVLQYGFHISPNQLWAEIGQLPQELIRLVKNLQFG